MLSDYREYMILKHIGFDCGMSSEATAPRIIREIEDVLIKSSKFSLPSKRALYENDINLEFIVIDAIESSMQSPKKQREYYSGKKRNYTLIGQSVIDKNESIICANTKKGTVRDFKLFKQSRLPIKSSICIHVYLGYQGIKKRG